MLRISQESCTKLCLLGQGLIFTHADVQAISNRLIMHRKLIARSSPMQKKIPCPPDMRRALR